MSQPYKNIKAYTRATHTVAKTRQVVMLYDGMIRFLKQASEAMENGAIEERYLKLTRVTDVLTGLQGSLDFDSGGQTAQVLYDFYGSLDSRITELHRRPDIESCRKIIQDIKEMRDVWDSIDRGAEDANKEAAAPSPEEPPPAGPDGSMKFSA